MYDRSARYYDHLYHFKDYVAASRGLQRIITDTLPGARTLLDVACGTGKHLEQLRGSYDVEGLDLNPRLLDIARQRCPDVTFHLGDMAAFDLGRTYDVVTCLFSSIAYVKTVDNLYSTVQCLARHASAGGVVIVEPFFTPEQYWVDDLVLNVCDEPSTKIAWMYKTARQGNLGIIDIHHLAGTDAGIEYFCERHELGLFTADEYAQAFSRAGLVTRHDPVGLFGRGMYIGMRPADAADA